MSRQNGFTLLEALIGIALLAIIASFSFLAYFGYQRSTELNANVRTIQDYLRQAQNNARLAFVGVVLPPR